MERRKPSPQYHRRGGVTLSTYPIASVAQTLPDGVDVGAYQVVYRGPLQLELTWAVYGPPNPEGQRPVISTFKRYQDAIIFACALDNGSWGGNLAPIGGEDR